MKSVRGRKALEQGMTTRLQNHPEDPLMRPSWNTVRKETKRDDSVELFRFFYGACFVKQVS